MSFNCLIIGYTALLLSYIGENSACPIDINESSNSQRVGVDLRGQDRVCLRCLNANGETSLTTIWGLRDGSIISDRENQNPTVGEYFDGVLVLLPGVLGNGSADEYGPISCFSGSDIAPGYNIIDITLYSTGE